ncbi:MAG: Octanoyltransferase [Holosporales bacterium]
MIFKSFKTLAYEDAIKGMEDTVQKIIKNEEEEQIWFLEHPSVYTAGLSAKPEDLINPIFPVIQSERGGQYTYHGKGQLVIYPMVILKEKDVRKYIQRLACWIVKALKEIEIECFFDTDHVGIWVNHQGDKKKIASIGIRLKKWVSYHGISLNINPNLDHFKGIVPCGLKNVEITSIVDMGKNITRHEMETVLKNIWPLTAS